MSQTLSKACDVKAINVMSAEKSLYVSRELIHWETDYPKYWARDVTINDTTYRKLDAEYYAWLRCMIMRAKEAACNGRLQLKTFEYLQGQFNVVHIWAVNNLDENELGMALQRLDPKRYQPPVDVVDSRSTKAEGTPRTVKVSGDESREQGVHLFPKDGNWANTHPVSVLAVRKVDAIKEQALSLGWTEATLYQNCGHFALPYGNEYGLVCFVEGKRRIGKVSANYIEIIGPPPQKNILRFFNPAMDQPWLQNREACK